MKKVKQCDQILSKPCRFQPFKCLDAVGDHPLPAREKPAASDVQPENCDCTITMTTTTGSQSSSTERARQAIGHDPPAGTERLAGTPDMGAADAVKDDVYTPTREVVNFFHEVLILVVDWDT